MSLTAKKENGKTGTLMVSYQKKAIISQIKKPENGKAGMRMDS